MVLSLCWVAPRALTLSPKEVEDCGNGLWTSSNSMLTVLGGARDVGHGVLTCNIVDEGIEVTNLLDEGKRKSGTSHSCIRNYGYGR